MIDFVVAAGWLTRRRVEVADNTPKKDRTDLLSYKTDLADRLLQGQVEVFRDDDEDDGNEILPETPPKRRKPTPLPHDLQRTSGVRHMPELVSASTTRHRCRVPGCNSTNARFFCTTCKVHLCITNARNCFKLIHEL